MSSREDTATRCLSVEKVPTELMEVLKRTIGQQTGLSEGNIPVAEVAGYHAEKGVGRFVFLLDYKQSVDRLCDEIKGVTVNKDGTQLNLQYERSTECEIPEEWTKFEAPAPSSMGNMPRRPAVPPKAPHKSQPCPGMLASGFYQNVGQPPGQALGPGPMPQNMRPGMPQPFPPQLYGQGQPGMQGQGPFPQQYQGQPRGPFQQMPVFPRYNPAFMQFGQMGPRGPVRFPRLPVPPKPGEEDKPQGQGEGQYQSGQDFSHMPMPQYFDPQLYQMFAQANFAKHPDEEQPHSGPPPPYNGSIPEQTDHTYNTDDTSQKIREEEHHLSELKEPVPSPRNKENESKKDDIAALTDDELSKQLTAHGMDHAGPIVASTRQVYENKLASLIVSGGAPIAQPTAEFGDEEVEESFTVIDDERVNKILVSGLPAAANEDYLELIFEKQGGPVKSVEINIDEDIAVIEFEHPDVARRVVEKGQHKIGGKTVQVSLYEPVKRHPKVEFEQDNEKEEPLCSIKVTGISKIGSMDTLKNYFENTKRSGGGSIKMLEAHVEEDYAYATFEGEDVAKRVADRGHKLNKVDLNVSLYKPPKPRPAYLDRLIIKGVNPTTTKDCLFIFLEAKSGASPTQLVYGEQEGTVMVTFDTEPDFEKLVDACRKRPLEKSTLNVSKVCMSNCIIISNLKSTISIDTVQFYFENKRRSNGGEIEKVKMLEDSGTCLVFFQDYAVVDDVLQQKHKLDGQELKVEVYIENLGRSQGDGSEPRLKIPDAITIDYIEEKIVDFMKKSDGCIEAVNKQLDGCYAKVVWPEKGSSVVIECEITVNIPDYRKLVKDWKTNVERSLKDYVNLLGLKEHPVWDEGWEAVLAGLGDISIDNPDGVALFVDKKEKIIRVVGYKHTAETVSKTIEKVIKNVNDEIERNKQTVKQTISNLKPLQLRMLLASKYPVKMEKKFANLKVKINQSKNELIFEGVGPDIQSAKVEMYEKTNSFAMRVLENIPQNCIDLFHSKQVKDYIVKKLKSAKLVGVWEATDLKLAVCSFESDLSSCVEFISEAVKEKTLHVQMASATVLTSQQWLERLKEIHSKNGGLCKVSLKEDFSKVFITATDDIVDELVGEVGKFLKQHTILNESLTSKNKNLMSMAGKSSLIRKPLHEEKKWIPYEISKLGNESVALYKQTLEDGEENDYSLRLMIVGPYGVGKTTFTHRLMNDNVTDNEVKSTNGIDVHVRTCEVTLSTNEWKAGKCDTIYKRMVQAILSNKTLFKKSQVSSTLLSVAKSAEVSKESVDSWTISSKQVPMLSKEHRTVPAHSNKAVKTVAKFSDSLNTDETLQEELKRLTNETEESDWSNTDETADVSIWDFGGQSVFYTTHQMFLSHRPVYILMTDISKHSIKTGSGSGRTDKDIVDCLDKWLNSIYGQADPHQEGMPPVIFIGTHADKLKEEELQQLKTDIVNQIKKRFSDRKNILEHLKYYFWISNKARDEQELGEIKDTIIKCAKEQSYWGQPKPAKWIPLEKLLEELRLQGRPHISREDIEKLNKNLPVPLPDGELDLFLKYQHESGNFVYFGVAELEDIVVLDPQWFIDALNSLITTEKFCDRDVVHAWIEFKTKGKLKDNLIDAVWSKEENRTYRDHKEFLLRFMEYVKIIVKPKMSVRRGIDLKPDLIKEMDYYLAPCMLKDRPLQVVLEPDVRFINTSWLCISVENNAFPSCIISMLLASCIMKWPVVTRDEEYLLFAGCGVFEIDQYHHLTLFSNANNISLRIVKHSLESIHPDVVLCNSVRTYVLNRLGDIYSRLRLKLHTEEYIRCPSSEQDDADCMHSVADLKHQLPLNSDFPCYNHGTTVLLHPSKLLQHWFSIEKEKASLEEIQSSEANQHGVAGNSAGEAVDVIPEPEGPITQEHINHARLCNVLVTVCAAGLGDILENQVPAGYNNIYNALLANKPKLTALKLFRKEQMQIIYPDPKLRFTAAVDQFDITILCALIRNVSSVLAPANGWGKPPVDLPRDTTLSANVERIRILRNEVSGHSADGKLDDPSYQDYMVKISSVMDDIEVAIGNRGYKEALEKRKNQVITPLEARSLRKTFQYYQNQLQEKVKSVEKSIKELSTAINQAF